MASNLPKVDYTCKATKISASSFIALQSSTLPPYCVGIGVSIAISVCTVGLQVESRDQNAHRLVFGEPEQVRLGTCAKSTYPFLAALNRRCVAGECSMLSSCIFDAQSCLEENISELGPFPPAVHYGCLSPIYSIDLLYKRRCHYDALNMRNILNSQNCTGLYGTYSEECPHCMTPIAGAL